MDIISGHPCLLKKFFTLTFLRIGIFPVYQEFDEFYFENIFQHLSKLKILEISTMRHFIQRQFYFSANFVAHFQKKKNAQKERKPCFTCCRESYFTNLFYEKSTLRILTVHLTLQHEKKHGFFSFSFRISKHIFFLYLKI